MSNQDQAGTTTRSPSDLLDLGSYSYLVELSPMAAYAVRAPDGVIAWFNSRATELWGRVPVIGDTDERFCGAFKLYHRDGSYMAHCETPVALALSTGVSVHEEEVLIERPDGTRVTVSVHIDPIRDKGGAIVGVVNFFRDISERKQAERVNSLLAAIVDSSEDAIVSKNLDGVITSWNRSSERLFGYSAEEAIGQNISFIIPPDRLDEEKKILMQLRRGEQVDHFETVRVRKDGTTVDISLTISPVKDETGRVIGASKVARDISERKQLDQALRENEERLLTFADELENQVRVRTREVELRNAEVLQQAEQLRELSNRLLQSQDEERRRVARELHDGVGQLLAAARMSLSKVDRERSKLSKLGRQSLIENITLMEQAAKEIRTVSYLRHPPLLDEVGLESAVRWYVEGFAERSKIAVNMQLAPDFSKGLPRDVALSLFRIVQECLTNIHRHSGSPTALVGIKRLSGEIILEVQDEGSGLSPELQSNISSGKSAGVGLRGMRERTRQLGGRFEIKSDRNGTRVVSVLPVADWVPPELETAGGFEQDNRTDTHGLAG
jgi:PAS domain S-box-containing protein